MDSRLLALKLFLSELGVSSNIDTVTDRKRVQKAVYLGQLMGVDLGYRFGWYLMGPYSTELTKDYYALAEGEATGDDDIKGKRLRDGVQERLKKILPIFEVPPEVSLGREQWLELLASYHYLREVRKLHDVDVVKELKDQKASLAPYSDAARDALVKVQLLPSP